MATDTSGDFTEKSMLKMYKKLHKIDMHIRFIRLSTKKQDKDTRITNMIPKARQRVYYLNDDKCDKFYQEFVEYPYSRTRDIINAWAYDACLKRPLSSLEVMADRKGKRRQRGDKDITGYGEPILRQGVR